MARNDNLSVARKRANDEFYTRFCDIEAEVEHYRQHFAGKRVYCNCDVRDTSNFWKYFYDRYASLGLNELVASGPDNEGHWYSGDPDFEWVGGVRDGDFRSEDCVNMLELADIVVTNPPFSLFREYVALLMEHKKKFLIIGNLNAVTYKEFFPYVKQGKVWLGHNSPKEFVMPDGTTKKFGNCVWYTNLDYPERHVPTVLTERYDPKRYLRYDNFDAINVDIVSQIPYDYDGVMGVPMSFMKRYCPEQFEICGLTCRGYSPEYRTKVYSREEYLNANDLNGSAVLEDGRLKFCRLLICRR